MVFAVNRRRRRPLTIKKSLRRKRSTSGLKRKRMPSRLSRVRKAVK